MKKGLVFSSLFASLVLMSCQNDEELMRDNAGDAGVFVTAELDNGISSRTQLSVDENNILNVLWEQGDAINVFMGTTTSMKGSLVGGEGETRGRFKITGDIEFGAGTETDGTVFNNVAYYPFSENLSLVKEGDNYVISTEFPTIQTYRDDSFDKNVSPAIAVAEDLSSFKFKNVGSIIRLRLVGNESSSTTITKITFTAKDKVLAGECKISMALGGTPDMTFGADTSKVLIMDCGEGVVLENDKDTATFVFVVPPMSYESGDLTATIYDNNSGHMVWHNKNGRELLRSNNVRYTIKYASQGEIHPISIGEKGYATIEAALKEAKDGDVINILDGEFELPSGIGIGSEGNLKTVTFKGIGYSTILKGSASSNSGNPGNYAYYTNIKFENLTYKTANNGYNGGFGHAASVDFKNCKIVGQFYAHSGAPHTFTDCLIDPLNGYLYTYASDCTFTRCTFAASEGKALQVYEDASEGENTVNIVDCTFEAAKQAKTYDGKPVTGIDINSNGAKFVVNITNTTTTGFPTGLNSGTDLWNVKNTTADITVCVNGKQVWPHYSATMSGKTYATIQAAIDDSEGGETIYVEAGQYTEILKVTGGKSLTIQPANEGDEVVIAGVDHQSNGNPSTVLFKNLKFDNSLQTEGWFTGTAQNIKPCVGIWGGNLSFEDCEFMVSGQSGAETGVMTWWTGENKATLNFKNCTFNGLNDHASARGMQIYGTVDLTVEGCTFNTYKDYSLKYVGQEGTTATFKNNIVNNTENFVELGSSVYPGKNYTVYFETSTLGEGIENFTVANAEGQKVYVDGIEVYPDLGYTVDDSGNITVLKAKGLKTALELAGAAGAGNTTITIADNLDMKDIAWTPISVDGYHGADIVTIEGNNKIITNLAAPLFAGGFAGGSGIVIKDLTIANSTMVSSNTLGSGAFIESADSMDEITLINCHLENSSLKGSRTGGLLGWTAGYNNENDGPVKTYVTIKNCSVVKCEIEGSSVGGIYGHAGNNAWTYSVVENCTVTNCKLNSIDDGGWRVGVVVGTANVGELTITNITESGNTLTQTGKTAPIGEKRNYFGRFVPTTTGKLIIDGVTYVTTADALKQAVSASTTNFYLLDGEYDIDGCGGKTLTISGSKNVIIKVVGGAQSEAGGQLDYGFDGSTVTFNGVTIKTNNKTYAGYARLNATYNNVTFESCYCLNGTSTFEGCTFNVAGDQYNLWTWGAPEATFTTCIFNSDGKAVLLYGTANTKLTLNQCTFNDTGVLTAKKAAVEIGNDYNKSYELIVNNTTVNGYEINDVGINTGTTLWANKNSMSQDKLNVVVDGVDVY